MHTLSRDNFSKLGPIKPIIKTMIKEDSIANLVFGTEETLQIELS